MPEDKKYITGHLRQLKRVEKQIARKARQARAKAGEIARQLACRYGAKKIHLFGSLATGEFDQDSDIDLAVAGLPEERLPPNAGARLFGRPGEFTAQLT